MNVRAEQFQLGAIVYDIEHAEISPHGIVCADDATPKVYPNNKYNFYCPDCCELGHFTRLVRIKETDKRSLKNKNLPKEGRVITPAKFDLYDRAHSTHQCNHVVRYKELEALAERYDTIKLEGNHAYAFPITMHKRISGNAPGIYEARRLENVLYSAMYDTGLRDKQKFIVNDKQLSLKELFKRESYKDHTRNHHYYAAILFKPNALPKWRYENAYNGEIAGYNNTILSCTPETYEATRRMIERKVGEQVPKEGSPVLVFARAVLNVESLNGRQPFTRYSIDNLKQIKEWNHPTSFENMIASQAEAPAPYNLPLFNPVALQFG